MAHIPAKASTLLADLAAQLPVVLGRNLVGIYLYGSVTDGAFNPKRSDIDCIVLMRRDLSDAQFRKTEAWLAQTAKSNPCTTRLQMLFLAKNELLIMNTSGCLYQFGVLTRCGSDGNPIIWLDFLRSGKVLFGPRPESFLPEITPKMFFQALERELGYLREEIIEKPKSEWRDVPTYRAYAVLTVCRILYSLRSGSIVSKRRAAKWAIKNFPENWSEIIRPALLFNETGRESNILLMRIKQFIDFADGHLHAAAVSQKSSRKREH
jgi:aminoglycoside adenylyltransferase-like protein/nucleotidyltransferase-like protein